MAAAVVTCLATSSAAAQPVGEAEVGVVGKGELNLVGPGFASQTTRFQGVDEDGVLRDFSFATSMVVAGPLLGMNVGFAPTPQLRWGLRASLQGLGVLAGGQDIPATGFNALLRATVGPTFGLRFAPQSPFELEFGLGFAAQMAVGGQVDIGSPENRYPLGASQYGVDMLARGIWRPWGAKSAIGFQAGIDLGWAMTGASDTTTQGIQAVPELGLVVGL
jgi:hypothetical protein